MEKVKKFLKDYKIKKINKKLEKNPLTLFKLRSKDYCPVCSKKLEVKQLSLGIFAKIAVNCDLKLYCQNKCFSMQWTGTDSVRFSLFDKSYGEFFIPSIKKLYNYSDKLHFYADDGGFKLTQLVKDIQYFRENERYVAVWLGDNKI